MTDKKYELTNKTIEIDGRTLYQIRSLRGLPGICRGAGYLGGYIEKEENLSHDGRCWIGYPAKVYGNARVHENAYVGSGKVYDNAEIFGDAYIDGDPKIHDDAKVHGKAHVCTYGEIYGTANIHGDAHINDYGVTDGSVACGCTQYIREGEY